MTIMSEEEWEELISQLTTETAWPYDAWHWEARRRARWGCTYHALIHEEANCEGICSMLAAAIALEDDGTYSVIENGDVVGLDATGFASPECAKTYVETRLQLDEELIHLWNAGQ
jgi:hypothetical protein